MNIEDKYNKLIYWFKEISKIPRNSTKEERIACFICNFAKERGLEYKKDNIYNVLVKKKASSGFEGKDPIIFQAHTDMVCEKAPTSFHNFENDGIEIIEDKDTFKAKGTTLGADDGIGVATLLLLLDDNKISHPDIYCLFTTQEEIGMIGAKYFDYSGINATYLINVDGEEEKSAIMGCAGGARIQYKKELELTNIIENIYKIKISGLHGGHSGEDINKNRLNSNFIMASILNKLENVKINSFIGGNKDNAIPNYTEAIFSTTSNDINSVVNNIKKNIRITEDDINLKIEILQEKKYNKEFINNKESENLIYLLLNLKQNVIEYNKDIDGAVETSGNIGIVNVSNGKAMLAELIRSSDNSKKEKVKLYNNNLAEKFGYNVFETSSYPGWKYVPNTKIEESYIKAYKETHDLQEPIIRVIHAGVECGLILEKMPNLQMISIGPDIVNVHTISETLNLTSCKKFLNTLFKLIENL